MLRPSLTGRDIEFKKQKLFYGRKQKRKRGLMTIINGNKNP